MNSKHKYRYLSKDKLDELFSNYLLDSWSFSKVSSFSRNEKAFEMQFIYNQRGRRSASEVSGSAYHYALQYYFLELKERKVKLDLAALQMMAFNFIDEIKANDWKIQKTNPTISDCIESANSLTNALLKNFLTDIKVYEDEIAEILDVEVYCDEFLTINGVDIPLPCHAKIDLVVKTKDGKVVIIDHKSKKAFTDEKELKFTIGKQAITYVNIYETKTNVRADEVWFIENKSSMNKDKSPQLSCFKIAIDEDTVRLYEAMLYEPLKRMLEAISNPDYVYLINEADTYTDLVELYEFWAQGMIAEVNDFNIPENKKELIGKRLKKIRDSSLAMVDPKAIKKFRANAAEFIQYDLTNKNMTKEEKIEHVLRTLSFGVKVEHTFNGYSSDTFLLKVSAGTNLSSIYKYKLDIASALNVSNIRMQKDLFVHEGVAYLAVEAGKTRDKDLLFDAKYLVGFKIPIGLNNFNQTIIWDMENQSTPHMLVCGSTGSGKSVLLISILEYAILSGVKRIVILDPKREFKKYAGKNIEVYNNIEDIEAVMELLVEDMNNRIATGNTEKTLVIFDEFADAVDSSRSGPELNVYKDVIVGTDKHGQPKYKREKTEVKKSLEQNHKILLQKGRSCGYRIIAATQRASVKVITGDAKVNFPVQICFQVPREIDSKVVIDDVGAESLSGKGDGLIKSPEYRDIVRFQAFYKN